MTQGRAITTPEMDERIISGWNAGEDSQVIAAAVGLTTRQIKARVWTLRKKGVDLVMRSEPLSDTQRQQRHVDSKRARELYDQGMSPDVAATLLGRTRNWCQRRWRVFDLETEKPAATNDEGAPPNQQRRPRKCLGHDCGRKFMSAHAGERLCPLCKDSPTHAGFLRAYA